ncbi:MAG: 30S ribosomal protein S3 [Chloroflexi bacterium CG07_land_8_20_14_0_80_45_17]|nr:MAG: 30S ribosomal protein S3 [Chloroflexi bacterium CG23_combo_of_CG06-09_8_20_14_all_45_10]PIU56678.1 MAG: 30S ribosomal protein S3 [Chloroflexi bacterium CG07_land_8_20_14_0_80_45_17]
MGQKVHPYGFRLGITYDWSAKWYAEKNYTRFLLDDLKLRKVIEQKCSGGGVVRVEIERPGGELCLTLYSAHPGILIGRGGQNVEALRSELEKISGERVRLTIREVEHPELEACLLAQSIAERVEGRIPYRRVMKQAAFRTMQAGAKGIKITCAGRLGGAEIARSVSLHQGQMPLHKLCADISYGFVEAHTVMGHIGVKVWIYKGDIVSKTRRESVTAEASEVS